MLPPYLPTWREVIITLPPREVRELAVLLATTDSGDDSWGRTSDAVEDPT